MLRRVFFTGLAISAALFLAIQLVPYGRNHANPPTRSEPRWSSPQARELAVRACFDCHSNETSWPWYASVAPVSWLIQRDVDEGRRELNFSEWNKAQEEAEESAEKLLEGEMPQWYYTLLHPAAKLSTAEVRSLAREFDQLLARSGISSERDRDEEDDD